MQTSKEISSKERPKGLLYAEVPPGGIPLADGTWVEEGSILLLHVAVYGVAHAPAAWKQSLKQALGDLEHRSSRYEPCIYVIMKEKRPSGHVLLDLDDIAEWQNGKATQRCFKIWQMGNIYKSQQDYCGRTIAPLEVFSFKIHQAKFIQERFRPIPIQRGRASNKEAPTIDGENQC